MTRSCLVDGSQACYLFVTQASVLGSTATYLLMSGVFGVAQFKMLFFSSCDQFSACGFDVPGIGVPILLAYVYGVVPFSLCRSGGCGVTTTNTGGVRFEFDEHDDSNTQGPYAGELLMSLCLKIVFTG